MRHIRSMGSWAVLWAAYLTRHLPDLWALVAYLLIVWAWTWFSKGAYDRGIQDGMEITRSVHRDHFPGCLYAQI